MLSTVLIIDKRKELSVKYKKSLEDTETAVIITRSLKDAILAVRDLEPDMIIVSDSIEESLSGFCEKIRALTYNFRPVIIALSKSADYRDRISILESGADDFLSEPVNIDEFKTRIHAHLRRDIESNLDNKTLLPNKRFVKKVLKRVINAEKQAVLLVGIEGAKEYKSFYTELAADKIVQTFVAIAKSALNENDFIGQLDETNFVIVTSSFSAEKLAAFLTFAFDTVAPKFYSEADSKRGYMLLEGERYAGMRANFVSILIGGIIEDFGQVASIDILIEKLFELKKLAKIPAGSNYMIERVKLSGADSVLNDFVNKNIYIQESDDSLRYLMQTALELQGYDVQSDLDLTSSSQPKVVIIDSGEDLSALKFLRDLKQGQNFVNTKFIVTTTVHDKSAILDSGADLYLPKPYEISDLIRWVEYFKEK